jgi:hypothetical protein
VTGPERPAEVVAGDAAPRKRKWALGGSRLPGVHTGPRRTSWAVVVREPDRRRGIGEGKEVAWSPDGRSILFASSRDHPDNYRDIYMMRPDGSGVKRLTCARAEAPAWSPDGRFIVSSAPGGLFVMRADGSGITLLPIEGVGEAGFPDWQ